MIRPTVGRKLWFHPHVDEGHAPGDQPHSAEIVHVLDDRTVNLAVFNQTGALYSRQAVPLLQDDDVPPASGHFAMWMPYQQGQAAKAEAAETSATALQLAPVHEKIDALAQGIDGKFQSLGDWLTPLFADFEARLAALSNPTATDLAPTAPEQPADAAPPLAPAGGPANAEATGTAPQTV